MKEIIDVPYINISISDLKVEQLPVDLKRRILRYLKSGELGIVGDCAVKDPFTGEIFTRTSAQRVKDGFEWWTIDIYLFEKYDISLSNDFMKLFQ